MLSETEIPHSLLRLDAFSAEYFDRIRRHPSYPPQLLGYARTVLSNLCRSSLLCMRVKEADVRQILEDDRLKEMVELGHGTTTGGVETRKACVHALFDADVTELAPREFPKYGYLGSEDPWTDLVGAADLAYHYGNVRFVFRRSHLAERTTLVLGDSVLWGNCYFKMATRLTNPLPICFDGLLHHEDLWKRGRHKSESKEPAASMISFCLACAEGRLTAGNISRMEDIFDGNPDLKYIELHFHGEVIPSRDLERIDFLSFTDHSAEVLAHLRPWCAEWNIPLNLVGTPNDEKRA